MSDNNKHVSVLLDEAIEGLSLKDGATYVDGTFGAGGHSRAILKAANCNLYSIDRDPNVVEFFDDIRAEFGDRAKFLKGNFGDMDALLKEAGVKKVDGILLDIGVSSMQIDIAERGFSFNKDGPLDMRMSGEGESAEDFINSAQEEEIANVIYKYGGERKSRAIARLIVIARGEERITTTLQLAGIVKRAVRSYNDSINPATRTFQALRIWVNDELEELSRSLIAAEKMLAPGGRLAVITFHSGEDSIVKQFLADRSGKGVGVSRYQPLPTNDDPAPSFSLVNRKAIKPSDDEIKNNIRARSAKLRVAERTKQAAW